MQHNIYLAENRKKPPNPGIVKQQLSTTNRQGLTVMRSFTGIMLPTTRRIFRCGTVLFLGTRQTRKGCGPKEKMMCGRVCGYPRNSLLDYLRSKSRVIKGGAPC